jgi:FAD/FMN-containing dehydrogenase
MKSTAETTLASQTAAFIDTARRIVGSEAVAVDEATCALFSVDFSEIALERAAAVVRPSSTQEVSQLAEAAQQYGVPLIPRGGGMSYTLCYAPTRPGSVILDMQGMNRILSVDLDNLTITVEPGVTWAQIHERLLPTGYRIGFMGTMSGIQATVGGGLGNNATGHGRGDIYDDLLGIEVVLPNGRVVQTGGRAFNPDAAVNRGYGPDFTGLFVHDAGAFGIKTKATFRLQRRPQGTAFVCYGFRDLAAVTDALIAADRLGIPCGKFAFASYHHAVFANQKPTAEEKRAMLKAIIANSPNKRILARNLFTLATSRNMQFLKDWPLSTYTIIDGFDQKAADRAAAAIGAEMRRFGGRKLNSSLGLVLQAQPFVPIDKLIVGMNGECSFPSNYVVPYAKAHELVKACEDFFAAHDADMKKHGVFWTRLFVVQKGMFGIEPIIYWQDRMNPLRLSVLSEQNREKWGNRPDRAEARAFALDLRRRLATRMEQFRPYHYQAGKYYDYRDALASANEWALLDGFKSMVDPNRLINPGALGL